MVNHVIQKINITFEIIFKPETINTFFGPQSLWGGLFIGILWGFVLQKAQVCKYEVVTRLFMLQEFTVFRVGAPLIGTTMVLLYFLHDLGIIPSLVVPKTLILAQILGGLFMGAGIAIAGYCPGTSAGALGEGALDAFFFMLGMFCASAFFAEIFPFVNKTFFSTGDYQNLTFPELFNINHWLLIIPFVILLIIFDIGMTIWDWLLYLIFLPVRFSRTAIDEFEKYINDLVIALQKLITLYFILARKLSDKLKQLSTDPEYTPHDIIKEFFNFIRAFSQDPNHALEELFKEVKKDDSP